MSEQEEVSPIKAVNLVTIKELKTLYKNGEPANAIELAVCEEHSFDIVVQKGLYVVGEAMDVTGWLGGFNFQWAWASGAAAGKAL